MINGDVWGMINGDVWGMINGDVWCMINGDVWGYFLAEEKEEQSGCSKAS